MCDLCRVAEFRLGVWFCVIVCLVVCDFFLFLQHCYQTVAFLVEGGLYCVHLVCWVVLIINQTVHAFVFSCVGCTFL